MWREIYCTRSELQNIVIQRPDYISKNCSGKMSIISFCGALLGALLQWENLLAALGSRGSDVQSRFVQMTPALSSAP
jgi:hypothetical protein